MNINTIENSTIEKIQNSVDLPIWQSMINTNIWYAARHNRKDITTRNNSTRRLVLLSIRNSINTLNEK